MVFFSHFKPLSSHVFHFIWVFIYILLHCAGNCEVIWFSGCFLFVCYVIWFFSLLGTQYKHRRRCECPLGLFVPSQGNTKKNMPQGLIGNQFEMFPCFWAVFPFGRHHWLHYGTGVIRGNVLSENTTSVRHFHKAWIPLSTPCVSHVSFLRQLRARRACYSWEFWASPFDFECVSFVVGHLPDIFLFSVAVWWPQVFQTETFCIFFLPKTCEMSLQILSAGCARRADTPLLWLLVQAVLDRSPLPK